MKLRPFTLVSLILILPLFCVRAQDNNESAGDNADAKAKFDKKFNSLLHSTQTESTDPKDPTTNLKADFEDAYRAIVEAAIKANIENNTAASKDYWDNSRDFCFSTKPVQPDATRAEEIMAMPARKVSVTRSVSPDLPYFKSDTESGKAMIKTLRETMAKLKAKDKYTKEDAVELMGAALPFMRTVEAAAINKGSKIIVPPHSSVTFATHPFCLQVDAPAVGYSPNRPHQMVGHERPVAFYPSSVLIPKEAQEIFAALIDYSPAHPNDQRIVQTLLWGIRGADLHPPFVSPDKEQLRVLNAALPDGAKKFANFIEIAQHPGKESAPEANSTEGSLLTLNGIKSDLLRHHLDNVVIKHGTANPYNPADVDTILQHLTNPGPIPEIETQPTDQAVQLGETVTFSVKVKENGTKPKYQWKFNDQDLSKADSSTLTFTAAADNVGTYQLIISTDAATVKSNVVQLTLNESGDNVVPPIKRTPPPNVDNPEPEQPAPQPPAVHQEPANNDPTEINETPRKQPPQTTPDPGASLIGDDTAAKAKQTGLSTGSVQIVNGGDKDYVLDNSKFIVATREPCQPSPLLRDFLRAPFIDAKSDAEAQGILKELEEFLKEESPKDKWQGLFSNDWLGPVNYVWTSFAIEQIFRAVPVLGSALSTYELVTGHDAFSGDPLNPLQRAVSALGIIPELSGFCSAAKDSAAASRLWNLANAASSESRALNPLSETIINGLERAGTFEKTGTGKLLDGAATGGTLASALLQYDEHDLTEAKKTLLGLSYEKSIGKLEGEALEKAIIAALKGGSG